MARRQKRMGKTDGYYVKKVWRLMMEKGAVFPDGSPLTVGQIMDLPAQPFRKNQLAQHLAKKKSIFHKNGMVRIRNQWGSETQSYRVATWLAHPGAYPDEYPEPDDDQSETTD